MTNKIRTDPPDDTGGKQALTRFKPGQSGNPKGRPKGARSRLGERFLDDLIDTWEEHGVQALERCAKQEPVQFVKVIANLLPREVLVKAFSANVSVDLSDLTEARNFLAAYQTIKNPPKDALAAEGALLCEGWRHIDD